MFNFLGFDLSQWAPGGGTVNQLWTGSSSSLRIFTFRYLILSCHESGGPKVGP